MNLKSFLDEALEKGETLKEEITSEILNSKVVHELLKSDMFVKALSRVMQTKEEVTKVIRDNVKNVLKIMDIPLRNEISSLEKKLFSIEKNVDHIGKKAIPVKSLKRTTRKTARATVRKAKKK
ncbi:hypothetical protein K1X76_08070 [bacterium]|nr:hypothetical protein [bacterium]